MLYLVPTPIGNLQDITLRALEVLRGASRIVCEDTRHTGKLLGHFEISKPLISFHEHSGPAVTGHILELLEAGENIALVSDSGMPNISDPGFPLVRGAIRKGIAVTALPGPNAAMTALAASGLSTARFSFFGFLPPKSAARRKQLEEIASRRDTLIFYESPYRLIKSLTDMKDVLGDREAAAARELSKKFEEIARGRLSFLIEKFASQKILGEFVLLVSGMGQKEVFT